MYIQCIYILCIYTYYIYILYIYTWQYYEMILDQLYPYRNKHNIMHIMIFILYICLVRDPIEWIDSLFKRLHHIPPQNKKDINYGRKHQYWKN